MIDNSTKDKLENETPHFGNTLLGAVLLINLNNMSDFKVGCSPLTSRIFAGKVLKNGTWGNVKHDVTDTAVGAVAQHLLQLDEKLQFQYRGKTYELKVVEVSE